MKYPLDIKEIIGVLISKNKIDYIYLNIYIRETSPFELIILVSNKRVNDLGDWVPKILKTIKSYPNYVAKFYFNHQAIEKIKEGNLFMFTSCQPKNLVYKKENTDFIPIPENLDFTKCKKLALEQCAREGQKVDEFKQGYYHFKEKGLYEIASFMLHQSIELTYRYLEILIQAKDIKTHSIRIHHLQLKKITSNYTCVFNEEDDNDIILLQALEDIYRSTRYENDFKIDLKVLIQLEEKMELLHINAIEIFDHSIKGFDKKNISNSIQIPQGKVSSTKCDIKKLEKSTPLKEIVKHITSDISDPITIYLVGQRFQSIQIETSLNNYEITGIQNYHFNLLLVSERSIRDLLTTLQLKICECLGVSLLLMSYTKDQVEKQLNNNNPYFHHILNAKESLLYKGMETTNWSFHKNKGISSEETIKKRLINWYNRKNNANGFFNGGKAIENSEEVIIKVLLFNKALKQALLGLLEYHFDYTPYQQNLNYLYNLVCNIWYFPIEIFPTFNKEDKRIFNEFTQIQQNVFYNRLSHIEWYKAHNYEWRCELFLEECWKLVEDTIPKKL